MATHHTVGGRLLVLFRGLRIPKEPSPDGAAIPIEGATYWYGAHFLLRRFAPAPRALPRVPFPGGLMIPEEPFRGAPVKPDGGHIPTAFAIIL